MTRRGMRRRGLGHSSTVADCLVPHSLAQHSPRWRPPAPLPNAHGLPVGLLRSPLRQRDNRTPPRRAAAEPPLPGGEKKKGAPPCVATSVRLPPASRGHLGPANAHGLPVGLLRSPLPPRSPAQFPNAHGSPVGSLRSRLRQRGNPTPSSPGSGGAAAARRREKEGEAAGCSSKREAPTGKPWASPATGRGGASLFRAYRSLWLGPGVGSLFS